MKEYLQIIMKWLNDPTFGIALRIAVMVLIVLPLFYILARVLRKIVERRHTKQTGMIVSKMIVYVGFIYVTIAVLKEFGFELGTLLGAAGIAAVAIGFAAQTSLSNIISGIFLISEKPFAVGDLIRVGDDVGFVMSIDLLSVKIRAMDNRFIRIPNENLIKSQVINLAKFPIRRIDTNIGVAYREDPDRVMEVLKDIARRQRLCLDEPEPLVIFQGFGDSSLNFMLAVWCLREDYLKVKNAITSAIKKRFDQEGIEIPFPHLSLYAGSETGAMPVRIMTDHTQTGNDHARESGEGQ